MLVYFVRVLLTDSYFKGTLKLVIGFQILERTGTAGGPEDPPLILCGGVDLAKPYLNYQQ